MCSDERFLPIFEKEQVGIIDGGILIDGDRQNDVPAVLGIEGGVPAELERAGRLAQSQAGRRSTLSRLGLRVPFMT